MSNHEMEANAVLDEQIENDIHVGILDPEEQDTEYARKIHAERVRRGLIQMGAYGDLAGQRGTAFVDGEHRWVSVIEEYGDGSLLVDYRDENGQVIDEVRIHPDSFDVDSPY